MKRFNYGLIGGVLLAVAIPLVAWASVHTATWQKATTHTDGSAIPATGVGSVTTTVEYGTCNGNAFGTKIADIVVRSPGTSAQTPNLPPGRYCVRGKHTTDTYNVDSDWTPAVVLVVEAPKPNPPTMVGVN